MFKALVYRSNGALNYPPFSTLLIEYLKQKLSSTVWVLSVNIDISIGYSLTYVFATFGYFKNVCLYKYVKNVEFVCTE